MSHPEIVNKLKTINITQVENTIHNPAELRHFLKVKPVNRRVRITFDEKGVAMEENIAWSYPTPFDFIEEINARISFFTDRVTVEEAPL